MTPASYPCPSADGHGDGSPPTEYLLCHDEQRDRRLLVVPALFDEGHRMRRLCVDVMERLARSGIDSALPDLPGTNESSRELAGQTLTDWQSAIAAAARYFRATHVLALRGGGLIVPPGLPGWRYGPVKGASLLRTLLRSRVLSSREAGREEGVDALLTEACDRGMELAGYRLGATMVQQLQAAVPTADAAIVEIDQETIGGSPLWLRAEPSADPEQADALAAYLSVALAE